jgi:SAM-dependent methyltransferase
VKRLWFAWRYLFRPPWDTGISPPELLGTLRDLPPGHALDLGCGTGTNLLCLVEHGWQATGIDFAPNAIARARRRLRGRPARAFVADVMRLADLPLDGPFDLALDIGCLHGLSAEGRQRYAAGLARWVRPGGCYLLYAWLPGPDQASGLTHEDAAALFAPHFAHTRFELGEGRPSAWHWLERTTQAGR